VVSVFGGGNGTQTKKPKAKQVNGAGGISVFGGGLGLDSVATQPAPVPQRVQRTEPPGFPGIPTSRQTPTPSPVLPTAITQGALPTRDPETEAGFPVDTFEVGAVAPPRDGIPVTRPRAALDTFVGAEAPRDVGEIARGGVAQDQSAIETAERENNPRLYAQKLDRAGARIAESVSGATGPMQVVTETDDEGVVQSIAPEGILSSSNARAILKAFTHGKSQMTIEEASEVLTGLFVGPNSLPMGPAGLPGGTGTFATDWPLTRHVGDRGEFFTVDYSALGEDRKQLLRDMAADFSENFVTGPTPQKLSAFSQVAGELLEKAEGGNLNPKNIASLMFTYMNRQQEELDQRPGEDINDYLDRMSKRQGQMDILQTMIGYLVGVNLNAQGIRAPTAGQFRR
jgi:hypothetical protein